MSEELVNIEVDGVPVKARKGAMIIHATDALGAYVPRFCARPSHMRVSTRHIQPVPSRQGVHWPQLSCL